MRVIVPISLGEALDKLSILMIKEARIADEEKREHIRHEMKLLKQALDEVTDYDELLQELSDVNEKMWNINEFRKQRIRDGNLDDDYLQATVKESNLNDWRFDIKNRANRGSEIKEQKSYDWI